ncbi:YidC/Oxa1 family membrane protein insertase [Nocardiopsis alkaliphila]|uniref:YidC/Oxa1 family membrane protein insertase n=1 Tax=Nocardiopsis alkaliphila TaxID=225762 RepID=UPI00034A950E|nr:membrane protein insertase YidC [Nocardiopsis alkaliphila]
MYTFGPISAAIDVLATILAAMTELLTPFVGALAAGMAVITLTIAVRVLLLPLGVAQVRAEKQRARIAPRLAAIGRKHESDPERMVAEQRKVYEEAGIGPLAGCLPGIAQVPLMIALYGLFIGAAPGTEALLAHTFVGVELGASLAGGVFAPVFSVMLVVLAVVAWATRRYVILPTMRTTPEQPSMLGALSYLQFGTVVVAIFVPLAAGLYLCASTTWALGEKLILRRIVPD